MRNKILIIHKGQFNTFPPLLSVKKGLNDLDYSVDVLTVTNSNRSLFNADETCYTISRKNKLPLISFVYWYIKYLSKIRKLIKKEYKYIWIEGGDTVALFGLFIYPNNKFIIQISELYDQLPIYKFLIGKFIKKFDKVVLPEINRAYIFKVWFDLKKLPYLLPNKPYYETHEKIDENSLINLRSMKYSIKEFARGRKIILYQGIIATDRKFSGVIDFVNADENFCLVLLGIDYGYLPEIDVNRANIYYAGFISPPLHLEITKLAHICLMAYDTTSLNKIYCAPNKIWEYAMNGKPILSQDLPGIDSIFSKYNFGQCCDVNDINSVKDSVNLLEHSYEDKCTNAIIYSESFNYLENLKKILRS